MDVKTNVSFSTEELQTMVIALIYANSHMSADIDQDELNQISEKLQSLNLACVPENNYTVVAHPADMVC